MYAKFFPAALLYINGLLYCGVAYLFLTDMNYWLGQLSISSRSDVGVTELRSVYLGFMAGFGLFLCWSAWRREWRFPGVVLLALTYAGLVAARSWGILVEENYNDLVLRIYIAEWLALVLSLLAILSLRRPAG
ncbi:MAG: hypothetical protein R3332_05265 [Pseudohongiellaceae bacterium]|nr:hypothetical protein [Pseudohongiellaceae bacterium]